MDRQDSLKCYEARLQPGRSSIKHKVRSAYPAHPLRNFGKPQWLAIVAADSENPTEGQR
jgi:hypothetical protein